jgi:hypothetical protein
MRRSPVPWLDVCVWIWILILAVSVALVGELAYRCGYAAGWQHARDPHLMREQP